ncbi:uncharacterized protein LOC110974778 [Acanthaster planci]|uniref:Uncharacterized protein LOC110974778 n=1 Tax=Acanthaster planci TaxID=133434 RepID=A0A8B7XNE2_ACAPL|nr:uncharacterized protein LOC110974778 [Acanthaster planci]
MAGLSMAALSTAPPCELVCENGGVLNFLDCGCRCASGYQGTTCQYNILNPDLVNDAVIASHDDVRQQLSAVDNTVNLLSVEPANTDPTATSTIISPPFSANDGHCSRRGSACQFVRFLSRVFPSLDFNSYPSYKGSYEYVRSDPYVRDSNISKPIIDSGYALPGTYGELLWRSRSNLLTFREPRPMPDNYFLY